MESQPKNPEFRINPETFTHVHRIKGYIQFDNLLTLFGTVPVAVNIV